MKKTTFHLLFAFLLLLVSNKVNATHLVGGTMSYRYLGSSNSKDRYEITVFAYRDCASRGGTGGTTVGFDESILVCAYQNAGRKQLSTSLNLDLISDKKVNPIGNTKCPELKNACLNQGIYKGTVDLDKTNFGYILKWERCCRNTQNNLSQGSGPDQGQTYTVTIPPSALKNSSPVFTEVPVPFICQNDTINLRNFAKDPDNDSLSYRLVTPYQGANTTNPVVEICTQTMQDFVDVNYRSGFSFLKPFGNGGFAEINPVNGLTTYYSSIDGRFAVAIEVTEWRNKVPISRVILDLQILVITCNPNKKPIIANSLGRQIQRIDIEAGTSFCEKIVSSDPDNGQSLTMRAFGDLLSGAGNFVLPLATFSPNPVSGSPNQSVSADFCWKTKCIHVREKPYLLTIETIDDGCPSKFVNKNIEIYVKPFKATEKINGPILLCRNAKNIVYTLQNKVPKAKYKWAVNGGVIVGSDSGQTLTINWGNLPNGEIVVDIYNEGGCFGGSDVYQVTLNPAPDKPIILGPDSVCLSSINEFTTIVPAGLTYNWKVNIGTVLNFGGIADNKIRIQWTTLGKQLVTLEVTNSIGCKSIIDSHYVVVLVPIKLKIEGPTSICPNNNNIEYKANPITAGSSYNWAVTGGNIASGQGKGFVKINWGQAGLGTISLIETNKFGCVGVTVFLNVDKEYNLKGQFPSGNDTLCENSLNELYQVNPVNGEIYNWSITGNGTIISGNLTNKVRVDWGLQSTSFIGVISSAFDPINNLPCISKNNQIKVELKPYPTDKPIIGPYTLCQVSSLIDYSVTGFNNSTFEWEVLTLPFTGNGTNAIKINGDTFGTFTIRVRETTEFGCVGPWNDTVIVLNPRPITTPIVGNDIICAPNYSNFIYEVSNKLNHTYNWSITNGRIVNGQTTNKITVDWDTNQNSLITVIETSDLGCIGKPVVFNVFKDNPIIIATNVTVNPPPNDDKSIIFSFTLLNAPRYNNSIIVQRKIAGIAGGYLSLNAINPIKKEYVDLTPLTDLHAYSYRAAAVNLCGDSLFSSPFTTILLSGIKTTPLNAILSFTPFFGWKNGVEKYELYRSLESLTPYELYRSYTDTETVVFNNGAEHYGQWYRIKAYEKNGDSISWSNDVIFYYDPIIFIPNAFSPNRNELNENFNPVSSGLKKFTMSIYSRWGELLFQTTNPRQGWDGLYKGNEAQSGVYVYKVTYEDFRNKRYETKGTLHLLR